MTDQPDLRTLLNAEVPHSARLWNYLLGGTENFAADREAAEHALTLMPELVQSARADREQSGAAPITARSQGGIGEFFAGLEILDRGW